MSDTAETQSVVSIEDIENSPSPAIKISGEEPSKAPAAQIQQEPEQNNSEGPSVIRSSDEETVDDEQSLVIATQKIKEELKVEEEEEKGDNLIMLSPIAPHFKTTTNTYLKTLQKLKDVTIDQINISDVESSDQNFRIAYEDSRKNMLMAPRLSKVPLILSGYHAEISAFSHSDILSLVRNMDSADFVRKTVMIANSIYEHVISTSRGDMTFEQWIAATKYPDLMSLFFGIYSGTYPGVNPYKITCPHDDCGEEFFVDVNNNDLAYISSPLIRDKDLQTIMSGSDAAIKELEIYKVANPKKPVAKLLDESRIYVEYTIPSIKDFLDTITAIQGSKKYTNVANIENYESLEFRFLYIYPYISKIGLPVIVKNEGRSEVSWKTTNDRNMIVSIVNALTQKDFESLYDKKEVYDLINERGVQFSIKAMNCPKCQKRIDSVPLDIKTIFFTLAQETLEPSL